MASTPAPPGPKQFPHLAEPDQPSAAMAPAPETPRDEAPAKTETERPKTSQPPAVKPTAAKPTPEKQPHQKGRAKPSPVRANPRLLALVVVVGLLIPGLWWGLPRLFQEEEPETGEGYSLEVWASGLLKPTAMAWGPDQALYVGHKGSEGEILRLANYTGEFQANLWVVGTAHPLGLAWSPDGWLFVSHKERLVAYKDANNDGVRDSEDVIIDDLPVGVHQNNGVTIGPDGFLYLAVGSTCDVCQEADDRSATILRVNPDTGNYTVYATGLRNSLDLAFQPLNLDLFAVDNGRDDLGENKPVDELNLIQGGRDYGWPDDVAGTTPGGSVPPLATFPAHSDPTGLVFTPNATFTGKTGDALVALFTAGTVVRVNLTLDPREPQGYRAEVDPEPLVAGLSGPTDLTFGPDGALYITDYYRGEILRVERVGQ